MVGGIEHRAQELKFYFIFLAKGCEGPSDVLPGSPVTEGLVAMVAGNAIQRQSSAVRPI